MARSRRVDQIAARSSCRTPRPGSPRHAGPRQSSRTSGRDRLCRSPDSTTRARDERTHPRPEGWACRVRPECANGMYVASPGAAANAQPTTSARTADVSSEIAAMPIDAAASKARASDSTSSIDVATRYFRALVAAVGAYSVTSVRKPSAENSLKHRSGDGPLEPQGVGVERDRHVRADARQLAAHARVVGMRQQAFAIPLLRDSPAPPRAACPACHAWQSTRARPSRQCRGRP